MRSIVVSLFTASVAAFLCLPAIAEGRSKWADIRVVTHSGETLADHRQYTDDVRVKTSKKADCFGESNPSSGKTYKLDDPTVLGALVDASQMKRKLRPLRVTDAFLSGYGSLGVCDIGGFDTEGFSYWYFAVNRVGAGAGANQLPVENGDRNLWYLTSGDEAGPTAELALKAPPRVDAGEPFSVKVVRHLSDGTREPAEGASVLGGAGPTGADGRTDVTLPAGMAKVTATASAEDVPAAKLKVCAADDVRDCPKRRGVKILGSPGPDRIRATRGPDRIRCGRGKDVVVIRRGERDDRIAKSCERVVWK